MKFSKAGKNTDCLVPVCGLDSGGQQLRWEFLVEGAARQRPGARCVDGPTVKEEQSRGWSMAGARGLSQPREEGACWVQDIRVELCLTTLNNHTCCGSWARVGGLLGVQDTGSGSGSAVTEGLRVLVGSLAGCLCLEWDRSLGC